MDINEEEVKIEGEGAEMQEEVVAADTEQAEEEVAA